MTDFGQLGVGFPRNSESTESKLFQTVLSACIADFQKFTISTPRGRRPSAASETAAAAPNSSFTATTAAASKVAVYETDGKEEGAARQASAQQQNGVTDATAERVDEAVTGETNISPAAPISEEHLGAHLRLSYTPLSPAHNTAKN